MIYEMKTVARMMRGVVYPFATL
ncbi:MAG: hypothetical protein QOK07_2397, partial [Gemmatimonadaceae bacterium]|nr:hypothetical protein [Gemmatimonadaceae bacterium]